MENGREETIKYSLCFPRYGEKSDTKLIDIIGGIQESLDIAIFCFNDKRILNAVLQAKRRNINVRIITDRMMAITPIQFFNLRKLKKAGIPIKKNAHRGFMHLKLTIADQKIVTAASANFTKSSQVKNDEFFMVITDDKIAKDYTDQFNLMWSNTVDFKPF